MVFVLYNWFCLRLTVFNIEDFVSASYNDIAFCLDSHYIQLLLIPCEHQCCMSIFLFL